MNYLDFFTHNVYKEFWIFNLYFKEKWVLKFREVREGLGLDTEIL